MDTVTVACFDGFDELDAVGPFEVFAGPAGRPRRWLDHGGRRGPRRGRPWRPARRHRNGPRERRDRRRRLYGRDVTGTRGHLDGRPAVTHGDAIDDLRATDAEVVDARVIDDGDVLTAAGVTSGLDLAMYLVDREWGEAVGDSVRTEMAYERRGAVSRSG